MNKPSTPVSEHYVSEHPEKDWERFKNAIRRIIFVSKSDADKDMSHGKKSPLRTSVKIGKS